MGIGEILFPSLDRFLENCEYHQIGAHVKNAIDTNISPLIILGSSSTGVTKPDKDIMPKIIEKVDIATSATKTSLFHSIIVLDASATTSSVHKIKVYTISSPFSVANLESL